MNALLFYRNVFSIDNPIFMFMGNSNQFIEQIKSVIKYFISGDIKYLQWRLNFKMDYFFDKYELCLVFLFVLISFSMTRKLLKYIPEIYFHHDGISVDNKIIIFIYCLFGGVISYLFNGFLLISLLFIFAILVVHLFIIDMKIGYLPDVLVYPLLWIGLLYQIWLPHGNVVLGIYGIMASYTFMLAITTVTERVRKTAQMGRGDFKFIAACAAWLGLWNLPYFLALAAFCGLFHYGVIYVHLKSINQLNSIKAIRIPFGPALVVSAVVWLYISVMNATAITTTVS